MTNFTLAAINKGVHKHDILIMWSIFNILLLRRIAQRKHKSHHGLECICKDTGGKVVEFGMVRLKQ